MAEYGDTEAAGAETQRRPSDKAQQDQPSKLSSFELLAVLRNWWAPDSAHCAKWHKQAKEDFDFAPGDQWTEDEKKYLEDMKRAPVVFNRTLPMIKTVAGSEINSRHQVVYLPRSGPMDARGRIMVKANETLSAASQWMDDTSDAEDNQSEAFQDMLVCGMGWSEPRVSYDDDPAGLYAEENISPLEMFWDHRAKAKNLTDRQRHWRKRTMLRSEARALFPDAADEDLNCTWVHAGNDTEAVVDDPARRHKATSPNADGVELENDPQAEVTILQVQWWEYEPIWMVAIPEQPDKPAVMTDAEFTEFRDKAKEVEKQAKELGATDENGQPVRIAYSAAKGRRKVYKQAFIGKTLLGEKGPDGEIRTVSTPQDPKGFTFHCITGHAHKTKRTWFGLVSVARDPQRFANSVLSTTKHILDSTSKGGIVAEKDAFEDIRQAEKTYSRPDAITWAAPGAISKNKIMAKPGTGIAAGYINLLDFAIASIRDVLGINLEIMGLRDANQPGILEAQRKQAAMTILATMFDSLRRYRKLIGRTRLTYIQRYLATDGRLIRITGEDGYELVKLSKQQVLGEYEVVVSDAPTSPNQKQETWGIITSILPAFKDMMTPEVVMLILEFSPLPSKLVDALKQLAQKQGQSPEAQQQKQLAIAGAQAEVAKDQAAAQKSKAGAVLDLAKAAAQELENQLAQAQASIAAALAGQQRAPLAPDMPIIEPAGPTAPQPAGPPPMPAPAEPPPLPELPSMAPGADMGDRVI